MQTPIHFTLRMGLRDLTRKCVAEVTISALSTVVVTALLSHAAQPAPPFASVETLQAQAGDAEAAADFMEGVALSHVGSLKPDVAAAAVAPAAVAPSPIKAAPVASRALAIRERPHPAVVRTAASAPTMLPAPPVVDQSELVAVADTPLLLKPRRPLRAGLHFVARLVASVPYHMNLVEGVNYVGGSLTSLASKL